MQLLPGEEIVTESNRGIVKLTSHRIVYENKTWGSSDLKSIMLEHITSCEVYYRSHMLFLALAVVCGLAIVSDSDDAKMLGIIGAIVFVLLYILTRNAYIKIASPTSMIKLNVTAMKKESVHKFIDAVETAKHKRLMIVGRGVV